MHDTYGFVLVSLDEENRFHVRAPKVYERVDPNTLTPCWPLPAAVNTDAYNGVYVGRGARREARRSCTGGHYTVLWPEYPRMTPDQSILTELANPRSYPTLDMAIAQLDGKLGVAFTQDMIIATNLCLVYRGTEIGVLEKVANGYIFVPDVPQSPLARRVQFKLDKEGVLCHSA